MQEIFLDCTRQSQSGVSYYKKLQVTKISYKVGKKKYLCLFIIKLRSFLVITLPLTLFVILIKLETLKVGQSTFLPTKAVKPY